MRHCQRCGLRTSENSDFITGRELGVLLVVIVLLALSIGMFCIGRYTKGKDLEPEINKVKYLEQGGCTKRCIYEVNTWRTLIRSVRDVK